MRMEWQFLWQRCPKHPYFLASLYRKYSEIFVYGNSQIHFGINRESFGNGIFYNVTSSCFSPGRVGWGIAWFINGQLIPVLTLKRNVTYTFLVSGGDDPVESGNYHPFYITDDVNGGYAQLTEADRQVSLSWYLLAQFALQEGALFNLMIS